MANIFKITLGDNEIYGKEMRVAKACDAAVTRCSLCAEKRRDRGMFSQKMRNDAIMMSMLKYERSIIAPSKKDAEVLILRLPGNMIEAIDDRRRAEPDLSTRPRMIRRALDEWLMTTDAPKR